MYLYKSQNTLVKSLISDDPSCIKNSKTFIFFNYILFIDFIRTSKIAKITYYNINEYGNVSGYIQIM